MLLLLAFLLLSGRLDGEGLDLAHLIGNTGTFAVGLKVQLQQLELLLEVFLGQRAQDHSNVLLLRAGDGGKGESVVGSAVENESSMRSSRSCDEDEGEAKVTGDDADASTSGGATTVERRMPLPGR